MILRVIFLLVVFSSCSRLENKSNSNIKFFGDSLKIEYTYKGDTTYQKRTNLKWKKGSKRDKVYFVKSIWKTRVSNELICDKEIKISKNNIDYYFCLDDVLNRTQKQLKYKSSNIWQKDSILNFQKELLQIENGNLEEVTSKNFFMLFDFVQHVNFKIYDRPTNSIVSKIRIEHYETNFSNGNIYYLINQNNDTIAKYHLNKRIK